MGESFKQAVDDALWKFLQRNHKERFYGSVELHFQGGELVSVDMKQVLKVKDLLSLAVE